MITLGLYTLLFNPLLVSLFLLLFGRTVGRNGAIFFAVFSSIFTALLACTYFVCFINCQQSIYLDLGVWVSSGLFNVNWAFNIDNLAIVMLVVVSSVSAIVHVYSTEYMYYDPHITRFLAYLSLFTFFMFMLVSGNNLIVMFLGWEGVGLCSYLLISFWYTRVPAVKSATKAIIVNRVGDFGLTLGIVHIFFIFQTTDFGTILALAPYFSTYYLAISSIWSVAVLDLICLLLFIGAAAKSAQLFLHTWLPDAMEGPTPVSALIHAATMVTAGVFLVIKMSVLFEFASNILLLIVLIGSATSFFAATAGLVQSDIKKVIAYSTCSQLGYMFFVCGLSGYQIGLFHLVNHAFFKALLFLGAGAVIHSVANEQDMRKFGGLVRLLPLTYALLFVGSLSLMGFPFLTGYYSKDLIIEFSFSKYNLTGDIAAFLGLVTAGITAFYSVRVIFLTFLSTRTNVYRAVVGGIHELPNRMFIPLLPLVAGSIFLGYMAKDLFVGVGTPFWNNIISVLPAHNTLVEAEFVPLSVKFAPLIISLASLPLVYFMYSAKMYEIHSLIWTKNFYHLLHAFFGYKWYFDFVYNRYINLPIWKSAYSLFFIQTDKGIIELLGPTGITRAISYVVCGTQNIGARVYVNELAFVFIMLALGIPVFLI